MTVTPQALRDAADVLINVFRLYEELVVDGDSTYFVDTASKLRRLAGALEESLKPKPPAVYVEDDGESNVSIYVQDPNDPNLTVILYVGPDYACYEDGYYSHRLPLKPNGSLVFGEPR